MRTITYSEAVHEAIDYVLSNYSDTVLIGEGVPDPKGVFGTTSGLRKKYGPERVLDMPLAENGMTGICIGAALNGLRPIMVHQRIDFSLLALDQIANNAAKWHYMFDGQASVPLVIRLIVGRGWGQGPQHSQSLHHIFAQIPGLKVVAPVTAQDAKGMLIAAVADDNPVIFVEHRWLHDVLGQVSETSDERPLCGAEILRIGEHITIVAISQMVIEALRAAEALKQVGVEAEVIDIRVLNPLDVDTVVKSVRKTGLLLVVDTACMQASLGHVIISLALGACFSELRQAPRLIANPDCPVPTSHFLAAFYYSEAYDIGLAALELLAFPKQAHAEIQRLLTRCQPTDIPNRNFLGPF